MKNQFASSGQISTISCYQLSEHSVPYIKHQANVCFPEKLDAVLCIRSLCDGLVKSYYICQWVIPGKTPLLMEKIDGNPSLQN